MNVEYVLVQTTYDFSEDYGPYSTRRDFESFSSLEDARDFVKRNRDELADIYCSYCIEKHEFIESCDL